MVIIQSNLSHHVSTYPSLWYHHGTEKYLKYKLAGLHNTETHGAVTTNPLINLQSWQDLCGTITKLIVVGKVHWINNSALNRLQRSFSRTGFDAKISPTE